MIRRACEKDLQDVTRLLYQVHGVHAQGRPDLFVPGVRKYTDEELLAIFRDDSRPVFVYENEQGQVTGHAFCVLEQTDAGSMRAIKSLYVDDICVDEQSRRGGVATALYGYVRNYACGIGCYHITLNVWTLNAGAQRFYEKMGMKPLKTVMEDVL